LPRSSIQALPLFSVLDRLAAEEPELASNTSSTVQEESRLKAIKGSIGERFAQDNIRVSNAVRQYKKFVKRDLEWLFNARQPFERRLQRFPELLNSVFAYGLPDFSSLNVTSAPDQPILLRAIEAGIEAFEPRLQGAQVLLDPSPRPAPLRLKINATVVMQPAPEDIHIDTTLDPATDAFEVR